LRNKPPDELSATDVKAYLTYLAVQCRVAASTQNQAFNALLFLFRHILKKDFGDHKDIPHYFDNLSNHKFAIGSHVVRHARSFLSGIHFFCILDSRLMAGMTNLKCIFLCNV